jgi:putative transcriptional regulator
MPLKYKIDVLSALKEKGYSTYRLRKDKIFGERVIQQLRNREPVSWEVLGRLCSLLGCDIGEIITNVPEVQ